MWPVHGAQGVFHQVVRDVLGATEDEGIAEPLRFQGNPCDYPGVLNIGSRGLEPRGTNWKHFKKIIIIWQVVIQFILF